MAAVAFVAIVVAALACGSPDPERREFVFTPVPYTVTPQQDCDACGTARACTEDGSYYNTDQVELPISPSDDRDVLNILDSYEFRVIRRFENERPDVVHLLVAVPAGSALAAVELLSGTHGIAGADLVTLFFTSDDPCRR